MVIAIVYLVLRVHNITARCSVMYYISIATVQSYIILRVVSFHAPGSLGNEVFASGKSELVVLLLFLLPRAFLNYTYAVFYVSQRNTGTCDDLSVIRVRFWFQI